MDYYYGTLLTNTSQLYLFGLEKYYDGMLLRIPSLKNPDELGEMTRQDKMFDIFKEHHRWQEILGIRTVGDFNQAIEAGHATDIINISEALQEKKIAKIAEEIASRKGVKLVLLADYQLSLDGNTLNKTCAETDVYPYKIVRKYKDATETMYLVDGKKVRQ